MQVTALITFCLFRCKHTNNLYYVRAQGTHPSPLPAPRSRSLIMRWKTRKLDSSLIVALVLVVALALALALVTVIVVIVTVIVIADDYQEGGFPSIIAEEKSSYYVFGGALAA